MIALVLAGTIMEAIGGVLVRLGGLGAGVGVEVRPEGVEVLLEAS